MISNVDFNSRNIQAGQNIVLIVDAKYPISIEVYCFVTQPKPPKFVPCPDSGRHDLTVRKPFYFRTSERTFENSGHVEFRIVDAEGDFKIFIIEIKGLSSSSILSS